MPNFNKGVFEDVRFEAIPIGKLRILSSVFRWYRPYAPGSHVDFNLKVKSYKKGGSGIRLILRVGEKEESIGSYFCSENGNKIKVDGISLSEETKYCLKSMSIDNKSEVVVSVIPSHNDQWIMFVFGSFITLLCAILAWLLNGLIHLRAFWEIWIPSNLK